jgi:hypothetical protein
MNKLRHSTTEDFLRTIQVESTKTYSAITHGKIIDTVKESLYKQGITLLNEDYMECQEGKIAQGNYTIGIEDGEMALQIAWQNSTNKQVSFKYALGSFVFVCTNSAVSGDMQAFRKIHKGNANIESFEFIQKGLGSLGDYFENMVLDREKMKAVPMDLSVQAKLVGSLLVKEKIINLTQVGIISREIENPSFDYGADNSLWQFYQHCTHSFKEVSPRSYIPKQLELSKYLQEVYL